jgi:hypothetical protein
MRLRNLSKQRQQRQQMLKKTMILMMALRRLGCQMSWTIAYSARSALPRCGALAVPWTFAIGRFVRTTVAAAVRAVVLIGVGCCAAAMLRQEPQDQWL